MKLKKALEQQKDSTEQVHTYIAGILGIPLNGKRQVEVQGRNSFLYVRLRNNQSEVIQAFNNQVSPAYNLPVLVERQGNRYVVVSVDTQRYDNNWSNFSSYLPRHGNTHSFDLESGGGGDVVWVQSRQIVPLLAMPSGSDGGPNVIINPYTLKNSDGTWKYIGNTGTQNISSYRPSSPTGAIMVLVYADSVSGNPYILVGSGTVFSNAITGTSQIPAYVPSITNPAHIPLAAVRLITGSNILSWNNIYDVRQWLHTTPTGTGGGSTFTGDANSVVLTDSGGALDTMPWLKWGTSSEEFIEFGADEVKESNAGKIGYQTFDNYFDIVGAGTGTPARIVKIYDKLYVDEIVTPLARVTGTLQLVLPNGTPVSNLGIDSNGFVVTGTPNGLSVQDEGVPVGSPTTFNFVGSNVHASISGSVVRVFVTGSSVSGLDSTYLRLDTSNDPLYGQLAISGSFLVINDSGVGSYIESRDGLTTLDVEQFINADTVNGTMFLYRSPIGTSNPVFYAPVVDVREDSVSGSIYGGILKAIVDGTNRLELNPHATGSVASYLFDTARTRTPTEKLVSVGNFGSERFYINASGTAFSNNQSLVKEAPVDGSVYGRKNAGWQAVGGGELIQDIRLSEGSAFTFDFQNIPSTYKHLKIEFVGRSNRAATGDGVKMAFNNITGSSYIGLTQWGAGQVEQATAGTPFAITYTAGGTSPAGYFSNAEMTIFNYADVSTNRTFQSRGMQILTNSAGNFFIYDSAGIFLSTGTVISRVTLYPEVGTQFAQWSRATLYGL